MENDDNYVTILTGTYPHEILVSRGILEADGIVCFVKDEFTAQMNPFYSNAIGGIKLQVKQQDAERALALLKQQLESEPAADEINEATAPENIHGVLCPVCGSGNVSKPKLSPQSFAISVLLLGFPLPFLSKTSHCFNCGIDFQSRNAAS